MAQERENPNNISPLISIIIPTYNAAQFLPEAVGSIRRQSHQPPLEIIIVDDGSTDDTAEVVQQLGPDIHYIYQENSSPAIARNHGLAAARGEIICFLDADDIYPTDKFKIQVTRLLNDPTVDVVHGRIKYIHMEGAEDRSAGLDDEESLIFIQIGGAMFRKSVFEQIGGFDEELRFSEDHDIFIRLRENNIPFVILNDITLYYRLHETNMTNDKTITDFQLLRVLKKSIDRRQKKHDGAAFDLPNFFDFKENHP